MSPTVQPVDTGTMLNGCSVKSATRVFATFASVLEALSYPPRELPSGSIVVDAVGKVRATLERHYSAAGRALPCWVLVP